MPTEGPAQITVYDHQDDDQDETVVQADVVYVPTKTRLESSTEGCPGRSNKQRSFSPFILDAEALVLRRSVQFCEGSTCLKNVQLLLGIWFGLQLLLGIWFGLQLLLGLNRVFGLDFIG